MRLAPWNQFKPSIKIFLLTVPGRYFFCGSFMLFLSCVCYAFVCACLLIPCGHLLGKGWPLGFRLWCLIVSLLLSHWYPGSGMVLDCIDSWSLLCYLLLSIGYVNEVTGPVCLAFITCSDISYICHCHMAVASILRNVRQQQNFAPTHSQLSLRWCGENR